MSRSNGGVIGVVNTPTASKASGIWTIEEVAKAKKAGAWPSIATYALTASSNPANEGQTITVTLTTTGISDGTLVPYTCSGTLSSGDLTSGSLSGNFTITSGVGTIQFEISNDVTTEGSETLIVSAGGQTLEITINDTSVAGDEDFEYVTLLLHGDGTNGAQNNTFLDSSTNNFAITRNGNTTQGTFTPFSKPDGRWGNYFDGSGDFLATPSNSAFAFGTGDFTLECWVYATSTPSDVGIYEGRSNGAASDGFTLTAFSGSVIRIFAGSVVVASSGTSYVNSWAHVAVVRQSGTTTLYINGVSQGTSTSSYNCTNTDAIVGGGRYSGSSVNAYFPGYISNFRIVKGTAVYTGAFTPSTTPLTAITNTSLLTCQSNRFKDNSTNNFAITRNGDVRVTPFSPFPITAAYSAGTNGGSGYFDGSGDYLSVPTNSANSVGSGSFYFEAWVYLTNPSAAQMVMACATSGGLFVGLNIDGSNRFTIGRTFVGVDNLVSVTWVAHQWYHIAVNRDGTSLQFFVNGTQVGSTGTNSINYPSQGYTVGGEGTGGSPLSGYVSGLRLVKSSVNTGNFTSPTAPPSSTGSALCLNFTNGGIIDNSGFNVLETVGNAQVDTGTKKYGTGALEFDGTGDYLFAPSTPDLTFGTGDFTVEGWFNANSLSSQPTVLGIGSDAAGLVITLVSSKIYAYFVGVGNVFGSGGSTLSTGTWYHFAWVRSGSTNTFYINGTAYGVTYSSSANHSSAGGLGIGRTVAGSVFTEFNGLIDDLRITKGKARYLSNFTAPAAAFQDQGT